MSRKIIIKNIAIGQHNSLCNWYDIQIDLIDNFIIPLIQIDDVVIITGDLFNSDVKIDFKSIEIAQLIVEKLAKITKVIIQSNNSKIFKWLDNVVIDDSIIKNVTDLPNAYQINKSEKVGVIIYNDVDKSKTFIENKISPYHKNIDIYNINDLEKIDSNHIILNISSSAINNDIDLRIALNDILTKRKMLVKYIDDDITNESDFTDDTIEDNISYIRKYIENKYNDKVITDEYDYLLKIYNDEYLKIK